MLFKDGFFHNTLAVMNFTIEIEQEEDGRFLAEVIGLPGVLAYGQTREEAVTRVQAFFSACVGGTTGTWWSDPINECFIRRSMSQWSSKKAKRILAALLRIGWRVKRKSGSHWILTRPNWTDVVFAHDNEEIGPRMLARIAKVTGLRPEDLWCLSDWRSSDRALKLNFN